MDVLLSPERALSRAASSWPSRPAYLFARGSLSFAELDEASRRCARGLAEAGLAPGMRAALLIPPGPEFFILAFGLLRLGAVPALIDPGVGPRAMGRCLDELRPEAFLAVPRAHAAQLALGWGSAPRLRVTLGRRWFWGGPRFTDLLARGGSRSPEREPGPDETAAIFYTSGSTGPPKGALYTRRMFAACAKQLREMYGIEPGEVHLATFPPLALLDPALGMSAVLPRMDFSRPASADPALILETLRRREATHLFASPALLGKLSRTLPEGAAPACLRRVLCGGAPLETDTLERLKTRLHPSTRVHTPYGATEALLLSSIEAGEILSETRRSTDRGEGVCVGRPFPGVGLRVFPAAGESGALGALPPNEVGEIVASGPGVSAGYLSRGRDAAAKLRLPDGSLGHRTGDMGRIDEKGRLWLHGRESERVVTPQGVLYPSCEAVFNRHPAVRRCALVGVGPPPERKAVLIVETRAGDRGPVLARDILSLGAGLPAARGVETLLFHPRLPVDARHNAKIRRDILARWAERRLR